VTSGSLTCVVADDHPAIVDAVSRYLARHGIEVVDQACEGDDALAKIESRRPDVALIDLSMPGLGGVEVIRRARRSSPKTAAIVYTGHATTPVVDEALDAGARGLVLKAAPLPDLIRALEAVAAGNVYIDALLAGELAKRHFADAQSELSKRERQILRLLSIGMTNDEIGRELFISPETVRSHVRRAVSKLGASTRTEAVATALRKGLIT
jgi:DNA-binding NarL/FixJ family response regulator